MKTNKVTAADLTRIHKEAKILRVGLNVGMCQGPSVRCFTQGSPAVFFVVPPAAYYKFDGAQKAVIYGKEGKDYRKFKTASSAAKYFNSLLSKINNGKKTSRDAAKRSNPPPTPAP